MAEPDRLLKQPANPVTPPVFVPAGRGTDPGCAGTAPGFVAAYPGRYADVR